MYENEKERLKKFLSIGEEKNMICFNRQTHNYIRFAELYTMAKAPY